MSAAYVAPSTAGFLDRARTIARPGFNRWLVPPCALAIHLCIGMAYGFSVFWLPLSKAVGITKSVPCPKDASLFFYYLTTTACDWKVPQLQTWMFGLFFVFLGSAAALWGGWLERVGPRKAGVVAALCWCGGLVISAFGVANHQLWLIWLGSGVIGGIGLGLGYISPVSTLIKWFPDRRGMATGLAIMGFGGGAMIGSPLADKLMKHFATATSVGVTQTFLVLAAGYFVFMMAGALGYRLPTENWRPAGWNPDSAKKTLVTNGQVHLNVAWRTPQFWLVWLVLMLNVSAGIGILSMASPILQEVFGGHLIGVNASFDQLTPAQLASIAALAAGFTGLLSLFNIAGRIFWASLSDKIGRKVTYGVFFLLGIVLYSSIPWTVATGQPGALRALLLHHSDDVRRRLCHGAGVPVGSVWHAHGGCDPWPLADRLVGRRRAGTVPDRPVPRVRACPGTAEITGVQHHDVRARGTSGAGISLQSADPSGGGEKLHDARAARPAGRRAARGRRRVGGHRCGQRQRPGLARLAGRSRLAGRGHPAFVGRVDHAAEGRDSLRHVAAHGR